MAAETTARRVKQRGNGQGSIYQRKSDGRYVGELMAGFKDDGKRDIIRVYGKTKTEVQTALRAKVTQKETGTLASYEKRSVTVGQLMSVFLAERRNRLKPQSYTRYVSLAKHITEAIGVVRLSSLTAAKIKTFLANLEMKETTVGQGRGGHRAKDRVFQGRSKTLSSSTRHLVFGLLKEALQYAVDDDYLAKNPAGGVDAPKVRTELGYVPTAQEARKLLDSTKGDRLHPLWTVAVFSGARIGELLALTWDDMDFGHKTLSITRTLLQQPKDGVLFSTPKSRKSTRTVRLTDEAIAALQSLLDAQESQCQALGDAYTSYPFGRFVFATAIGKPLRSGDVGTALKLAWRRAGFTTDIHTHSLRHTAATVMLKGAVPLKTVSDILGHSGIAITANLYTSRVAELELDAVGKLEAALSL